MYLDGSRRCGDRPLALAALLALLADLHLDRFVEDRDPAADLANVLVELVCASHNVCSEFVPRMIDSQTKRDETC